MTQDLIDQDLPTNTFYVSEKNDRNDPEGEKNLVVILGLTNKDVFERINAWNEWMKKEENQRCNLWILTLEYFIPSYWKVENEITVDYRFSKDKNPRKVFECNNATLAPTQESDYIKFDFKNIKTVFFIRQEHENSRDIIFSHIVFEGDVEFLSSFRHIIFFQSTHFLKRTNFQNIDFNGRAIFENVHFDKHAIFYKCNLNQSKFDNVNFNGVTTFNNINWNEGVLFDKVKFHDKTSFIETTFVNSAIFNNAEFNTLPNFNKTHFHGETKFNESQFYQGASFNDVNFCKEATFSATFDKDVSFTNSTFSSNFFAEKSTFKGDALFTNTQFLGSKATFEGSQFLGKVDMSGVESNCVIDLRNTKIEYGVDLDKAKINFDTADENTSTAFRRLKKLAEDSHDHASALDFFAKEIRSSYDYALKDKFLTRLGYQLYDFFSNFGRSFWQPLLLLLVTIFYFTGSYYCILVKDTFSYYNNMLFSITTLLLLIITIFITCYLFSLTDKIVKYAFIAPLTAISVSIIYITWKWHEIKNAFFVSLSYSLPLYGSATEGGKQALKQALKGLFGKDIPYEIYFLGTAQMILSGIFIFLMALALRNMFRV